MLIVGAKGLAKEVLEIFHQQNELTGVYFYDDVSEDVPEQLYGRFTVLRNMEQVVELFKMDNRFTIGLGNPLLRKKMYEQFTQAGGQMVSVISPFAIIGHYGTVIAPGAIIMAGTIISNDVYIGTGCLINPNCTISHDTVIGKFVEISPAVQITGRCKLGDLCSIGTNATLLPKIRLGNNVIVGAGAVIINDVADKLTVVGVPAKVLNKKQV